MTSERNLNAEFTLDYAGVLVQIILNKAENPLSHLHEFLDMPEETQLTALTLLMNYEHSSQQSELLTKYHLVDSNFAPQVEVHTLRTAFIQKIKERLTH